MSANVTKKRNTSKAFADEENHADEPRKRPTTINQARSLMQQLSSSSIHPPERPESVLPALAIQQDDLEDVQEPELYTYKPLISDQIRLLRLHSGHGDDPIHCSLVTDSISAPSSYEALSYTWGAQHPPQKILLSDEEAAGSFTTPQTALVTSNLFDALKSIREPNRPLVLWVDALCIDQKNTTEKSHQVGLMTKIYSNAHRALVWLGNGNASTIWAASNIHRVLSLNTLHKTTGDASDETESTALAICMAWNEFLRSPWFRRVWILQELTFAKRATFIRGSSQLDKQDLQMITDLILQFLSSRQDLKHDHTQSGSSFDNLGFSALRDAAKLFRLTSDSIERSADGLQIIGKKHSLFQMIRKISHFKATDLRDKIFALLGMAADQDAVTSAIIADYGIGLAQLLKDVVEREIELSQSLDILTTPWAPRELQNRDQVFIIDDSPSWIYGSTLEDVRHHGFHSTKAPSRIGSGFTGMTTPFTASKDYLPDVRFQPYMLSLSSVPPARSSLAKHPVRRPNHTDNTKRTQNPGSIDKRVLVAPGIEVGTITDVSMRMAGGIVSRDCLEMAGMSFSEGCEALQNKPHKVWEQLWRILVADRNNEGFKAPTSFELAFFKLFKQVLRLRCIDTEEMLKTETDHNTLEFLSRVRDAVMDRRMFNSIGVNHYEETLIGLVPRDTRVGDQIIILFGGSVPIVVRPEKGNYVTIVGEAYVHGKMHGEAFHGLSDELLVERTREFQIV